MSKFTRVLLLTTLIVSSGTVGVQQKLHGMAQTQTTTSEADKMAIVRCGMTSDTKEALRMVKNGINPFVRDVDGLSCLDYAVMHEHGDLAVAVLNDEKVKEIIKTGYHDNDLVALELLCGEYGEEKTYSKIKELRKELATPLEGIITTSYWKSKTIYDAQTKGLGRQLSTGKVGSNSVWYAAKGDNEQLIKLNAQILNGEEENWGGVVDAAGGRDIVNKKDPQGRTPLMLAAQTGNEDLVKILINEYKAKLNLKDKTGRTALDYAAMGGHEEVVKLLLEKGAIYYHVQGRQIPNSKIAELLWDTYFVKDS